MAFSATMRDGSTKVVPDANARRHRAKGMEVASHDPLQGMVKKRRLAAIRLGEKEAMASALARRKDTGLGHVAISEQRPKRLEKLLADRVPHPFTSRAEYEASLQAPLGPEWNASDATRDLTRPETITRTGVPVLPLQYRDVKKEKREQRLRDA